MCSNLMNLLLPCQPGSAIFDLLIQEEGPSTHNPQFIEKPLQLLCTFQKVPLREEHPIISACVYISVPCSWLIARSVLKMKICY